VWILKGRPAPENIYLIKILINYGIINRIGGVMVRMHATSAVDRVFEPRSGQIKDYIKLVLGMQQSAGRHVAPLGHIILIPNQPVFVLSP
jgi:hypothetical protein